MIGPLTRILHACGLRLLPGSTAPRSAKGHVHAPVPTAARLALFGGAALYLVGGVAFRARMTALVSYAQVCAAALALILFTVSGTLAAWAATGVLSLELALLVGWEVVADRRSDARASLAR